MSEWAGDSTIDRNTVTESAWRHAQKTRVYPRLSALNALCTPAALRSKLAGEAALENSNREIFIL